MFIGAAAQSFPDIDFVAAFWNEPSANLLAHRGLTHSILFGVLAVLSASLLAHRLIRHERIGFSVWALLFASEIAAHLALDALNNYGVGLLEPFDAHRYAVNAVYVADPFFSVWPLAGGIALLFLREKRRRRRWNAFALITSFTYLGYCLFNKWNIHVHTEAQLRQKGIPYTHLLTTPAPLNNLLWYTVAAVDSGFYIGYRSALHPARVEPMYFFRRDTALLQSLSESTEVRNLLRFSQGYYTVERWGDTLVFNDLRFGQIIGWHDPRERFVFHYFLSFPPGENRLVVQRGRFARWDRKATASMFRRIMGR